MTAKYEAAKGDVGGAGLGKAAEGEDLLRSGGSCLLQASVLEEGIYDDVQWLRDAEEDLIRDSDPLALVVEDEHGSDSDHSLTDSEDVGEEEWEEEEEEEYDDDVDDDVAVPLSLRIAAPLGSLLTVVLNVGNLCAWVSAACDLHTRIFRCGGPAIVALLDILEIPALGVLLPLVLLSVAAFLSSLQPKRSRLLSRLRSLLQAELCCLLFCVVGLTICAMCYHSSPAFGPTLKFQDYGLTGKAVEQSESQDHDLICQAHHNETWHTSDHSPYRYENETIELTLPTSGTQSALVDGLLDCLHRGIFRPVWFLTTKAYDILQACGRTPSRDVQSAATSKAKRLFIWMVQLFLMLFVAGNLERRLEDAASEAEFLEVWEEAAGDGVPWGFRERARG